MKKAIFIFLTFVFTIFALSLIFHHHQRATSEYNKKQYMHSLVRVQDQSVSFYFTKDSLKYLARLKKNVPSTVQTCQHLLGKTTLPPVKIIFYDKEKKLDQYTELKNVLGFYDTQDHSINLVVPKNDPQQLISNMKHEFTHYYFNSLLEKKNIEGSAFPVWFHEGLASYIANPKAPSYKGYSSGMIPLSSLNSTEQWEKAMNSSVNPYGEAYVAIQLLIKNSGEGAIRKIINNVLEGEDFYPSLTKVSHLTDKQYEAIIKDYYME